MKPFRFLLFTLLAALVSCSDGIEDVAPAIASYTGLALAVPQVTVSSASKTMNATEEECTANDLYLFCFPVGGDGKRHSQELNPVTAQKDLNNDACLYNIILQPGTYNVYVVANMGDKVITNSDGTQKTFKDISEDELNKLPLTYDAATLPKAGNIPMVYSDKNVVVYDGKATEVAANLTFTCAKVVLNIIFDPDNTAEEIIKQQPKAAEVFNGINWLLTPVEAVKGNNLTSSTNLFTAPATSGEGTLSNVTLPAGSFYAGYTYNADNKDVTNADVVTPSGTAVATLTDALTNARKWLYRATYYLPERSVTKEADATALPVTGKIIGKGGEYSNTYNNISGDKLSTKSTENSTDYYKLERGHYYEIVSFVNGLGQYDLPTTVNVKDWETVNISADFLHTLLWVEKTQICTEAPLTTLTTATMTYKTNALPKDISVGCDTKVDGNDVISITNDVTDVNNKVLKFTVNPNIPFSSYTSGNQKGKAKVWIQAGNIKKYIDVYYSAEPFLIVTPQEEVIYWSKTPKDQTLIKKLKFKTNLGGIQFQSSDFQPFNGIATGGSHTFGNSTITVECTSNTGTSGEITVTADTDPVTTTEHTFTVLPLTEGYTTYANYAKEVKVTVKPVAGDYRIYMRAINDLQLMKSKDNGGRVFSQGYIENWRSDENNTPSLTNNGNWVDGWTYKSTNSANYEDQTTNDWSNNANADNHYAYIYTQIGETETASEKDKIPAWLFTATWPGDEMTADANNPGWYYINEKKGKESTGNIANSSGKKIIKPGETLIIFNNRTNTTKGYTLHRFTHHLDPGIPLFNFEDHEGWYLYDPLCDPYYRVFDDKPKVEDITYVIYTQVPVTGWYHIYGVATNVTSNTLTDPKTQSFSIYSNSTNSTKQSNGWYMMTLKFKCAQGYYDKAIRLNGISGDPLLFGGNNWTPTNGTITGYYDGSSWHEGEPKVAAKRRR